MKDLKSKRDTDQQLNDALKQTFPASDPIPAGAAEKTPSRPLGRKTAEINKVAVEQIAKKTPNHK